jgi:aminoglycoside phosphotransferase (APT) family kinase protein
MEAGDVSRAIAATTSTVVALGLEADDAVVLHNSNKLTLRLLPSDVVARVAPASQQVAQLEVDLAQQLVAAGCPVAHLDPRIEPRPYEMDDFVMTFWMYSAAENSSTVSPADYAAALLQLHAGMRTIDVPTPRFTDRVEEAELLLAERHRTPALADDDRELLANTLSATKLLVAEQASEQLLHGEPHPGNLLSTRAGPVFIDLETCCRGPVEFDLAHAPRQVAEFYPNVDQDRLRYCGILMLAMITTWRWDRTDQFPNGRQLAHDQLRQLRDLLQGRSRGE